MPLKYIYDYHLDYLNKYGNKLTIKDTKCHVCGKTFVLGDIVFSKFSKGAFDHLKRHLKCSIAANLLTKDEAVKLMLHSSFLVIKAVNLELVSWDDVTRVIETQNPQDLKVHRLMYELSEIVPRMRTPCLRLLQSS